MGSYAGQVLAQTDCCEGRRLPRSKQLEQIVGQADKIPLCGDFVEATKREASQPPGLFYLAEDGLNNMLARGVDLPARRGLRASRASLRLACLERQKHWAIV